MKKFRIILLLCTVFLLTFSVFALADEFESEEDVESIIPNDSIWKMTMDVLQSYYIADYEHCIINGNEGLYVTDVEVSSYNMNIYYVFEEEVKSSNGKTEKLLSKIAYVLSDSDQYTKSELTQCYESFVNEMKTIEGKPESTKKNITKWSSKKHSIEIGKGKLEKYTGSDSVTVGIIFKRPELPKPTAKPSPTPQPQYKKIDYKGVSRHPENYKGQYVKFSGIVVQVQETTFVQYEGGSLFDDYYVLRVASKYEKYQYIDGYDTDDIVYVVVPKSKVEGGRILEDDKIYIYGRYDGIETYTALLGNSISIPRREANRVIIQ